MRSHGRLRDKEKPTSMADVGLLLLDELTKIHEALVGMYDVMRVKV